MHYWKMILCFLATVSCFSLHAAPAQIIIIRHAEKPPEGNQLSIKGMERAAALIPFF